MGITTKYFTNTSDFKEITEKLRTAETLPDQIDNSFLNILGYSNPANDLILNFFKDLKFLNEDNTPTSLFEIFRETEEPEKIFAHSVIDAYGELFDADPIIHRQSKEEIKQQFQSCLNDDKSSIIINYMVNTFKVLVEYAGRETITEIWEEKSSDIFSLIEQQETDIDITNIQLRKERNNGENNASKASPPSTSVNGTGDGTEEAEVKTTDDETEDPEEIADQAEDLIPEVNETGEVYKIETTDEPSEEDEREALGNEEQGKGREEAGKVEAETEDGPAGEGEKERGEKNGGNDKGNVDKKETSIDLTAKEAISKVAELTLEEAKQFIDEDDDRVTVLRALNDKIEDAVEEAQVEEEDGEAKEIQRAGLKSLGLTLPDAPVVEVAEKINRDDYLNKAYIKKAELLYKLGRYEEALPALDKVYQKFGDSDNEKLYKTASVALIKKKDVAEKLGLNDYLLPIYSAILKRWGKREENEFTPFVDQAYINLMEILTEDNQTDRALEMIEKAIHRFKETEQKPDFLAKAMYYKAELLEKSGAPQKALEALDEVLNNFRNNYK